MKMQSFTIKLHPVLNLNRQHSHERQVQLITNIEYVNDIVHELWLTVYPYTAVSGLIMTKTYSIIWCILQPWTCVWHPVKCFPKIPCTSAVEKNDFPHLYPALLPPHMRSTAAGQSSSHKQPLPLPDTNSENFTYDLPKDEPDLSQHPWDPNYSYSTPEGTGGEVNLPTVTGAVPAQGKRLIFYDLTHLFV